MATLRFYLQETDHQLFHRIQQQSGWLSRSCHAISSTADGYWYVVLTLLYYFYGQLYNAGQPQPFVMLICICFAIERPVYFLLKNTCRRQRPPQAIPGFQSRIIASDKFSFPSGHTSAAFMFSVCCLLSFGMIALPLLVWAAYVGLSRIYLGVHFPTDVVVGAALGATIAWQVNTFLL